MPRSLLVFALGLAAAGAAAGNLPFGVVEGFYGPPWSHRDRLDVIEFMGRHGMNLYIYAPKDDPMHRSSWREPYSPAEMAQFRELVGACRAAGVDLCFAVSPGRDMVYSDPQEQALLLDKIMSLHPDGVRHFALFLDDIDVERMGEADRARFRTAVEAQMYLANRLGEQILAREPDAWLLLCPTVYLGVEDTPYWRTLRATLDPRWNVVWTGIDVVAPTITEEHLDAITAHLGRPPFIWDNYPVNDYARSRLFLGPLAGRTPALPQRISGYAANPMNQAHASMIALATIADFFRDPRGYDPEASWRAAIEEVGGAAAADLLAYAEQNRASALDPAQSRPLSAAVDAYLAAPSPATAAALGGAIRELQDVADRLPIGLNPALAGELAPFLGAFKRRMEAMELAHLFMENRLMSESVPALVRLIARERRSDCTAAEGPALRLFECAVGLRPEEPLVSAPCHHVDAVDPPLEGEYPGSRGENQLIVYTRGYGHPRTGTNQWGVEAMVIDGVVARLGGNDSPIPPGGFVVSGHGSARAWIETNLQPGVPVVFESGQVCFGEIPAERATRAQRLAALRRRALVALAGLVEERAPHETLAAARSVLRTVDALARAPETAGFSQLDALEAEIAALRRGEE